MRVVIFGAGEVGCYLARVLSTLGDEIILVDRDGEGLARAEEEADALTFRGDCTCRSVLAATEVSKADLVVAVTGSDDANVVSAALSAAQGARRAVARVDAPSFYATDAGVERGVLGIHALLCASRLVSDELLRQVVQMDARFVANIAGNALQIALVPLRGDSPALGRAPTELKVARGAHARGVLRDALLRQSHEIARLEEGDELLLVGERVAITATMARLRGRSEQRRAVIVGGGDVGLQLTRSLLETGRRVQLIERDRERCEELATLVPGANVIHGDGTSLSTLRDEHVEAAEFLLAVTKADEVNLMTSLVAGNLGVPKTFALVHRPGYAEVYDHLGIRGTAGPHQVIGEMVQWLLPTDGALAQRPLPGSGHHLLEYQLPATLRGEVPAHEVAVVPETVFLGAVHANGEIAKERAPLQSGDHVILLAPRHAQREVKRRMRALVKEARE